MTTRLVLLPYLQQWDGNSLSIRLLCLPRGSPVDALVAGSTPTFASAKFKFEVHLLTDVDALPQPGSSVLVNLDSPAPSQAAALFQALAVEFPIDPSPPKGPKPKASQVKKHLPQTYQDAAGYAPGAGSELVFTDDTYSCMLGQQTEKYQKLPPPNPKWAWGRVIALLLRNPNFGLAAGLIRPFDNIRVPNPADLKNGGYVYFTLTSESDAAGLLGVKDGVKIYAARIPPLTGPRDLFSPVLFPVVDPATIPPQDYAEIFAEVENYDDGWAKTVHCSQIRGLNALQEEDDGTRPPKEFGIRIGWDDEQVTVWLNRQLDETKGFDSPLGAFGYRVDVKVQGTNQWRSLVHATGPLAVQGFDLPSFDGELSVEVHPIQQFAQNTGDFWLPTYFTSWMGRSLVTRDEILARLGGEPDTSSQPRVRGSPPQIALRYGTNYSFRVRFADHTGGGPSVDGAPVIPGPRPTADIAFRRWVRPMSPALISPPRSSIPASPDFDHPPEFLEFKRPLLQYPTVECAGALNAVSLLIADLPQALAEKREPGLPDPDVTSVQITVEVAGLMQDPLATDAGFIPLFDTSRAFPSDPAALMHIPIIWRDFPQITDLKGQEPLMGALLLPRGRHLRLRIKAECKPDPNLDYFGSDDVRYGPSVQLELGQHSSSESNLFNALVPSVAINAFFLQPDVPVDSTLALSQQAAGNAKQSPSDITTRAAAAFGLPNNGLTYYGAPGRRTVFGCAADFLHTISPDLSSLTLNSVHDLSLHWVVVLRFMLLRDWTWDGFAQNGISIERDGVEIGRFSPNQNLDTKILQDPELDRTSTDLIFIDSIDPKPLANSFPEELNPKYQIVCSFQGSPTSDPPNLLSIRLPVTTAPTQVPKLVSVGIAMSNYVHSPDYSTSEVRDRSLWLEFDAPPVDPRDQYFARVLRNAPDPLLLDVAMPSIPTTVEPPLPIDPEPVRRIVPGEATDPAGLSAMQQLIPSSDPAGSHFLLPLPPGTTATSSSLFSFWTYEIRLGHASPSLWSTAQARFGPPLRVAGVQHPPPPLTCSVQRSVDAITVTAPFAVPVLESSQIMQANPPRSTLWALLYAQAARLDSGISSPPSAPPTTSNSNSTAIATSSSSPTTTYTNILVAQSELTSKPTTITDNGTRLPRTMVGAGSFFMANQVAPRLAALGFDADRARLSVLAVELMPQANVVEEPLGKGLGKQRILRTSGLRTVPVIC